MATEIRAMTVPEHQVPETKIFVNSWKPLPRYTPRPWYLPSRAPSLSPCNRSES